MNARRSSVAVMVVGTVLFGVALATRQFANPWVTTSAAAALSLALAIGELRGRLSRYLEVRGQGVVVALSLGLLLVIATHVGYHLLSPLIPGLEERVVALYGSIEGVPGAVAIPLILLIVATEELLWRGVAVELGAGRFGERGTVLVAVALYVVPQLLGGAILLIAAAVFLGAVLTVQRLWTGRLTEPIVTHAVWSTCVFCLVPLR